MNNEVTLKPHSQWDTSMLPDNVEIGKNNLPCVKTKLYGYGKRFNAFCTENGDHYHTSRCPHYKHSKNKKIIHRYEAINNGLVPCSSCQPKSYIDSWYDEFLKANAHSNTHVYSGENDDIPSPSQRQTRAERIAASEKLIEQIKAKNRNIPKSINNDNSAYCINSSEQNKPSNVLKYITLIMAAILLILITVYITSSILINRNSNELELYKTKIHDLEQSKNNYKEDSYKYQIWYSNLKKLLEEKENTIEFYEKTTNTFGGVVYHTKSGKKYHKKSCEYLNDSAVAIIRSEAEKSGFAPCTRCQ